MTSPSSPSARAQPVYLRVKQHVLAQIHSGAWREGDAIPGEETLARSFGVSRMTVNRALRELSDEQIVERVQGSGTYVAQQKYQATLVSIRNIADEIAARGHAHRSELHRLERTRAADALSRRFGLRPNEPLFHSVVVHFENDEPIQVEDRWVNHDFASQTPNAYLMRVAPLQGVSFVIEACPPPPEVAEMLAMAAGDTCLVLRRQTQSQGRVASVAAMWHPASRYQFTGSF